MKEVENREDLALIVRTFYNKIKTNEVLGPIFLRAIPEGNWESHLDKITEFWNSALFGSMTYRGNPAITHANLDKSNNHEISQDHFKIWLDNWLLVIDESWTGSKAEEMKMRARKMASGLFITMWRYKPEEQK